MTTSAARGPHRATCWHAWYELGALQAVTDTDDWRTGVGTLSPSGLRLLEPQLPLKTLHHLPVGAVSHHCSVTSLQFAVPLLPPAVTAIGASGTPQQVPASYGSRGDACDWCKRDYPTGTTSRDSETGKSLCEICFALLSNTGPDTPDSPRTDAQHAAATAWTVLKSGY